MRRIILTDDAIVRITNLLDRCCYGTWDEGQRMILFLRAQADNIDESLQEDMSRK